MTALVVFYCCDKDHDQNQCGQKRFISVYSLDAIHHKGKGGQEPGRKNQRLSREGCC